MKVKTSTDSAASLLARLGVQDADAAAFLRTDSTARLVLAGRGDGIITLAIEHRDGALCAELGDNGPPFDPLAAETTPPEGDIETREVGGLGLTLVKSFMDRLDYRRVDGLNRLTMEMKVKAA